MPTNSRVQAEYSRFVRALFAQPAIEDVLQTMQDLIPPSGYRIRTKLLYLPDGFPARHIPSSANLTLSRESEQGCGFRLREVKKDEKTVDTSFVIVPTKQEKIGALVSVCTREHWLTIIRLVRSQYPSVVPIYLSQRELVDTIHSLRSRVMMRYDLRVREYSAREFVRKEGNVVRSVREWTLERLEAILGQAAERKQVFSSVTISFHRRVGDSIDTQALVVAKTSKEGEVELTGRFGELWTHAVESIAAAGYRKLSFFSHRGLRDANYVSRPVTIRFSKPVFNDLEQVRNLVELLGRYPRSQHSVTHGNPYAFVQVSDGFDGSSMDVWAASQDRITLVPRLKTTEAAIDRIVKFIFENFREGLVELNGQETPVG